MTRDKGEWLTLREASDATGIPIGTLRKWCRRESIDSYLESDGEVTLRIVEMGSVRRRASALGRTIDEPEENAAHVPSAEGRGDAEEPPGSDAGGAPKGTSGDTMIVPVDAWNKMLNQLGNLHEAGQQLAEARERAAKAETEATFLRERLAEMRESHEPRVTSPGTVADPEPTTDNRQPTTPEVPDTEYRIPDTPVAAPPSKPLDEPPTETVSFWRYVVRGWRGRRR